jgi:CheY-like chemotaxis protein
MMEPWQIQVDGIRSAMRLILDPADRATWQAKLDQLNADIAFSHELLEAAQRKESSKTIEAQAVETRIGTIENDLQQAAHSLPLITNHRQSQDLNVDLTTLEVIHVDDEGLTGWFQVFKHIIHGDSDGKYHEVVPVSPVNGARKESIEMAIEATAGIIEQKLAAKAEPRENGMRADQILFLDLRLFPSWDAHQRDPAAMSGALLLRRIRERHMTLPIVVTTASNKVWSFKVMRDLGADAFWIKEGWDHDWSLEDSVRNYGRLRELAARATSPAVRALRVLEDLYHKVTAAPSPWWEHGYWRTGEARKGDTSTAKMLHLSAIIQLRHYCQRYMYQELSTPTAYSAEQPREENAIPDQRSVMIASVSVLVASIVEAILFGPDKMTKSSRELRRRIRYHPGVEILDIRGEAAHKELIGYDGTRLIHMIELFHGFLTKPISCPTVPYGLTTQYQAYITENYVAADRADWHVKVRINGTCTIDGIIDHVDKPDKDKVPAKGVERNVYPMRDVAGNKYYFTYRKLIKSSN